MEKLRVMLSMGALLLAAAACNKTEPKAEPFGRLSVAEVAAKQGDKTVHLFDNNPAEVFAKAHLPGAKWVDPSAMTAADLPAEKDATLIFYCANER